MKCDEARPQCRKCISTGQTCSGYGNETLPSRQRLNQTQYVFENVSQFTAHAVLSLHQPQESPYAQSVANESRYLQFFMEMTMPQFLILFPEARWRSQILQIAYSEPGIRHALISLASSHEWYLDPTTRKTHKESHVSSRYYTMALRELRDGPIGPTSIYLNLCSCLLFLCIEGLSGRIASSMRLFQTGRKMIKELRVAKGTPCDSVRSADSDAKLMVSSLETMFYRLEVQLAPVR